MLRYKFDILAALKTAGYNTSMLRLNRTFSEETIHKFRHGDTTISLKTLDLLCCLLNKQPSEIVEYIPDKEESGN